MAHHYEHGGFPAEAAFHYLRAGNRSLAASANHEAIAHLSRGVELVETVRDGEPRRSLERALKLGLGTPLGRTRSFANPEVGEVYHRARELCDEAADPRDLCRALRGLFSFHLDQGDLATARRYAEELVLVAEAAGQRGPRLVAHLSMAIPLFYGGDSRTGWEHVQRALALYDVRRHRGLAYAYTCDPGVQARIYAALCTCEIGFPDRAAGYVEDAIALAHDVDHPFSLGFSLVTRTAVRLACRDREGVLASAEEALALAESQGATLFIGMSRVAIGWATAHLGPGGAGPKGVAEIEGAIGMLAAAGSGVGGPRMLGCLVDANLELGRIEEGLGAVDVALGISAARGQPFHDAELLRLKGELLVKQGDGHDAAALFDQALETAHAQNARIFELRAAASAARWHAAAGERVAARERLQSVYDGFEEGFGTPDLVAARTLLAELA